MAWLYLIIAGTMEWAWAIGLKFAWDEKGIHYGPGIGAVAAMILSGLFLLLAQRAIPIGTAYAVWTGIGAVGTFALGIMVLGEEASIARFICVALIIGGIVGLKLTSSQ